LTSCLPSRRAGENPATIAPANPTGSPSQPQAVALLESGNYLIVTPNNSGGIDAAVFDPQMNLVSVARYAASQGVAGIGLADLNGDGIPDIVYSSNGVAATELPETNGQLTIMLGNGGSSFQSPTTYPVPPVGAQLSSFAIGDLNGDHKLDIALAVTPMFGGPGGSVMIFLGSGDGMFHAGSSAAIPSQTASIAIADLNGDGRLDLVVTVYNNSDSAMPTGNSIAIALGNGDGTFAAPSYTIVFGESLAIGDMNADAIPDIVTTGTILFGDGKGSFPNRQDYDVPAAGSVILTDFNDDGKIDVVIAGGTPALLTGLNGSSITVLFGQPDGTFFGPSVGIAPGLAQPDSFVTDLRTVDFNGDGIPDLAYAGEYGIGVMLGNGDGVFASSFTSSAPPGWEIATGDFNGDGSQDVVTVFAYAQGPGGLTFFAGKGDGTFQPPLMTSLPAGPAALVTGDFNGDGKLDLAVLFSVGSFATADAVTVYLGNGDGSFRQGASYPAGPDASWMLAGDLNNDGNPDLAITNSGAHTQIGNVSTLLGKGDGTFVEGTRVSLPVSISGDSGPSTMSLADFNRDGKLDLAVTLLATNTTAAGFAILLGKGDGTFQPPIINSSLAASSIAAADIDSDGIPGLIVIDDSAPLGQILSYLPGNGDGSFQARVYINLNPGLPILIADVNRNGKADLVSVAWPLGFFSLLNLTQSPRPVRFRN
jgi:hypothetical protein